MQIKNNLSNYLKNPWIIGVIKISLLSGCLYFVYSKLRAESFSIHEVELPDKFLSTLILVFILMIINWYLESLRWKYSIELFESISIKKSAKVVLGGLALNWILPFTSGDLLSRISTQSDKYRATSAVLFNRSIMLSCTLLLGSYGLSYITLCYGWNFSAAPVMLLIPLIVFLFRRALHRFIAYFKEVTRARYLQIIGLSVLRYSVFALQFFLLLKVFMPVVESHLIIAGIGWIYLIRSSVPLLFGGVGVREASGILFFEPYIEELQMVVVPISIIWMINTVIPSLVGLLLIMKHKPIVTD